MTRKQLNKIIAQHEYPKVFVDHEEYFIEPQPTKEQIERIVKKKSKGKRK